MTSENLKRQALVWLFEKPLPVIILLIMNVAMGLTISKLWDNQQQLQNQMYELQNAVIKENTAAMIEFNLKK